MYSPLQITQLPSEHFTDYSRWRLRVSDGGRHTWHYLESDEEAQAWPQTIMDKYWLGLDTNLPHLSPPKNAFEAARNGFEFFRNLQAHDGHWPGEVGGSLLLLPGLIIGSYVAGMGFTMEERLEIIRYLMNKVHQEDGGWGIHTEGPSTVFGTALNYVAIRLLGIDADHPVCVKARATLHKFGGATACPSWGKFWLSVLNVYEWEGNNPIPPEMWILPDWMPFHPHRWWIHARTCFVPMSYLYGVRFKAEEDNIILSLREELYLQDYYTIDWPAQRNNVAKVDLYTPHSQLYDWAAAFLGVYEQSNLLLFRRAALEKAYTMIVMEDDNTGYQTIALMSKMFNLLARFHKEGVESEAYKMHELRRRDFMWVGPDGMMILGTNGSQSWDMGFIMQAVVDAGLGDLEENKASLIKALKWLDQCQIRDNPKHYHTDYRHTTKGAWPFSTQEQGYTVSDTTAEGLKAVLYFQYHLDYTTKFVSERRLCDAVDVLLSMQNPSGGVSSYEPTRGRKWLEWFNPTESFGSIMIDYSYPECTTSVITALDAFRKLIPRYRRDEIDNAIRKAIDYLHNTQRPDGSWIGSWGVCFTYCAKFTIEGLSVGGETYENSESVRKACNFLTRLQRDDGGWGESYESCEQNTWIEHKQTQVVQTCWAALGLIYGRYPHPEPIEKAVKLVMSRQRPDGSWVQEALEGVFSKTCPMSYSSYRFSFPIWMLGMAHQYLGELKEKGQSKIEMGKEDPRLQKYTVCFTTKPATVLGVSCT